MEGEFGLGGVEAIAQVTDAEFAIAQMIDNL
jgi:hypothetical protein